MTMPSIPLPQLLLMLSDQAHLSWRRMDHRAAQRSRRLWGNQPGDRSQGAYGTVGHGAWVEFGRVARTARQRELAIKENDR